MPRSGNQEAKKAVKPNWLSIKRFGLINSLGISCARRYSLAYSLASIAIIIILLIKLCR
jgi:hypothetical protein